MVLPLELLACVPDQELDQKQIEHIQKEFPDCEGDLGKTQQYFRAYAYLQLAQTYQLGDEHRLYCKEELDLLFKVAHHECETSPSVGGFMALTLYMIQEHVKQTNHDLYRSYTWE